MTPNGAGVKALFFRHPLQGKTLRNGNAVVGDEAAVC